MEAAALRVAVVVVVTVAVAAAVVSVAVVVVVALLCQHFAAFLHVYRLSVGSVFKGGSASNRHRSFEERAFRAL